MTSDTLAYIAAGVMILGVIIWIILDFMGIAGNVPKGDKR